MARAASVDPTARTKARLAAVQALYQMETAGAGVEGVIVEFMTHRMPRNAEGRSEADDGFFAALLRGVIRLQKKIDPLIERHLANRWTLTRLDATARAILRAAAYELIYRREINERVIIDEYMEIANAFFEGEDPRFINGVLDHIAGETRRGEQRAGP